MRLEEMVVDEMGNGRSGIGQNRCVDEVGMGNWLLDEVGVDEVAVPLW